MATLDVDVQTATTLINELVAEVQSLQSQLASAGSGVPAADQTNLETAITAGQAVLPATTTPPVTPTPPAPVPAAATPVVSDPAVA